MAPAERPHTLDSEFDVTEKGQIRSFVNDRSWEVDLLDRG